MKLRMPLFSEPGAWVKLAWLVGVTVTMKRRRLPTMTTHDLPSDTYCHLLSMIGCQDFLLTSSAPMWFRLLIAVIYGLFLVMAFLGPAADVHHELRSSDLVLP